MAPKGGKGGGSSGSHSSGGGGGHSSCSNCLAPLHLSGSNWKDGKTVGLFAIEIIAVAVLLVCLVLSTRYRWVRQAGIDKLRNAGYKIATLSLAISYLLYVIDVGLRESETTVTYLYYILYILASFFWLISDITILGIILRTNSESNVPNLFRKMVPWHVTILILLGILSATAFGLYTAIQALVISGGYGGYYGGGSLSMDQGYVSVAYNALFFIATILAAIEAFIVLLRDRSKATLLMLAVVIPCLFIRTLVDLVNVSVTYFPGSTSYETVQNLNWATAFVETLVNIGIFLGVVLVGYLISRKTRVPKSQEYVGPNHAPVSTSG